MRAATKLHTLALTAFLVSVFAGQAHSQPQIWPSRPVTIIVPVAPGGVSDTLARALVQRLTQSLGQQFIVENRGGAAAKETAV